MISSILRILKGEVVFTTTAMPGKYTTGKVIMISVGGREKSTFRVTGVTKSSGASALFSVWGKEVLTSIPNPKCCS